MVWRNNMLTMIVYLDTSLYIFDYIIYTRHNFVRFGLPYSPVHILQSFVNSVVYTADQSVGPVRANILFESRYTTGTFPW